MAKLWRPFTFDSSNEDSAGTEQKIVFLFQEKNNLFQELFS
jgi:hypothetical protein